MSESLSIEGGVLWTLAVRDSTNLDVLFSQVLKNDSQAYRSTKLSISIGSSSMPFGDGPRFERFLADVAKLLAELFLLTIPSG